MLVARFLLDANLVLQCRDLPELPWRSITDADLVELYPAPTALHEIDQHKTSGDRRSGRARDFWARMRKVLLSEDKELELRPHSPRLVLRAPPPLGEAGEAQVAGQSSNDYRIVEEGVVLAQVLEGLCLLSADTLVQLRAEHRNLASILVDEDWLLGAEADPKERRIAALERRVEALSDGAPIIEATLQSPSGADLSQLPIHQYGQLSPSTRDALVAEITDKPLADANRAFFEDLHGGFEIVKTSTRDLQDYRDRVEIWRDEVREALPFASPHAQGASRLHPFQLLIANTGVRPADHVKVKIEGRGDLILASSTASGHYWDADEECLAHARLGPPRLIIPTPPKPPTTALEAPARRRGGASGRYIFRRTSEDRGDEAGAAIVFECDDLRHGGEIQTLYFAAFLGGVRKEGEIKVTITAANLPEPVFITTPVAAIETPADIDALAVDMTRFYTSGVRLNRRPAD